MLMTLRATYTDGVFVPLAGESLPDLPEAAEVEITVRELETASEIAAGELERAALLREIAENMKTNIFTGDPPRFTREELHERR